jgi:hypothetical protein
MGTDALRILSKWHVPCDTKLAASLLQAMTRTGCEALETLPHCVGALTALRTLNLAGCSALSWLPGSIGSLHLTLLSLARCVSLEELPPQMSTLTSLASLDLGKECAVTQCC